MGDLNRQALRYAFKSFFPAPLAIKWSIVSSAFFRSSLAPLTAAGHDRKGYRRFGVDDGSGTFGFPQKNCDCVRVLAYLKTSKLIVNLRNFRVGDIRAAQKS